jgi:hypothetical protein
VNGCHRLLIILFLCSHIAHKNANEPAGVLPHWQNSGRSPAAVVLSVMADVMGFCGKLLVFMSGVMAIVIPL